MVVGKKLNLEIDGVYCDYKLFETLRAIDASHSQRKAAASLGISHSVLNRRILDAEDKLSQKLVVVSNRGSVLTGYAHSLLDSYISYENRLVDDDKLCVVGGHVSCEFIKQLAISYNLVDVRFIETDIETSKKLVDDGVVDVWAFDDPVQAYLLDLEPVPLARDSLVLLVHDGEVISDVHDLDGFDFVEVNNSSQRLAWNTLADFEVDFNIVKVVNSFNEAIKLVENDDNLYTFINSSMSYRCQNTSNVISKETHHIISAVNVKNDTSVENFLNFASHNAQKLTSSYGFEKL